MCAKASVLTLITLILAVPVAFNLVSQSSDSMYVPLVIGLPALLLMASYCAFHSVQNISVPTM